MRERISDCLEKQAYLKAFGEGDGGMLHYGKAKKGLRNQEDMGDARRKATLDVFTRQRELGCALALLCLRSLSSLTSVTLLEFRYLGSWLYKHRWALSLLFLAVKIPEDLGL